MLVALKGSDGHSLREAVEAQVLVGVTEELLVAFADEAETATETWQAVELGEGARDDEVAVFVDQRGDIVGVAGDETGVGLVDEYHRISGDVLHDTAYLLAGEAVARGVVGRCEQEHAGMDAVGVFDDLVDMVGEGVFHLVEGVHFEGTATLAGHTVVVPP